VTVDSAQAGDASSGTRYEAFPVFFRIAACGGLLLAVSVFYDPRGVTALGGLVLFVLGVALLFSRSLVASRREGTGLLNAIVLSVRKTLGFASALMPKRGGHFSRHADAVAQVTNHTADTP